MKADDQVLSRFYVSIYIEETFSLYIDGASEVNSFSGSWADNYILNIYYQSLFLDNKVNYK